MKGYLVLYTILLLKLSTSFAQDKNRHSATFSISAISKTDSSKRVLQSDIRSRIPVLSKNDNTLVLSIAYNGLVFHHFPGSYGGIYHGLSLQAILLKKINERRSVAFLLQGGLYSDFSDISEHDIRYSAGIRYRYRHSSVFSSGWGFSYARQFFGNQLIPFLELHYKAGKKWEFEGYLPMKPKISYNVNTRLSLSASINGDASSYRLSEVNDAGRYIQLNQWSALTGLTFRFAPGWRLSADIGKILRQQYRLFANSDRTNWTIFTIPLGQKPTPIQNINGSGTRFLFAVTFQ